MACARWPSNSLEWKKRKCKQKRRPAVSFYKLWGARSRDDEFPHYVPWEHKKGIVEPGTKWKIPLRERAHAEWARLFILGRAAIFSIFYQPALLYIYMGHAKGYRVHWMWMCEWAKGPLKYLLTIYADSPRSGITSTPKKSHLCRLN